MKKRGMLLAVGLCAIALGSCASGQRSSGTPEESAVSSQSENTNSDEEDKQIRQIYDMYLANGGTLTYEKWLSSIKGEKGDKGDQGEKGDKGDKGDDGQTPYIGSNGNWWIGSQDTGIPAKGDKGETGGDGESPYIGENGHWWVGDRDTGVSAKGEKGDKGEDGKTYEAVVSVEKKSSEGNVDTYVITYADGKTYEFTVTNGEDGEQGIQGKPGQDGHTPEIEIGENGDWYVDGADTGVKARGEKGEKGDTGERGPQGEKGDQGKSAYELYKEAHPEYEGDEEQWLSDLESGKLRKITVTFDSDGGSEVSPVSTTFGSYVKVDEPTKDGYDFAGWSLNGSAIDINTYVFFADCTLVATWRDAQYVRVAFDPNDGVVAPGHMDIEYGKEYTLPTPSKEYQTFRGWKYGDTDIPLTGTWEYTHRDITLTASWEANTKVYVNLSVDAEYGSVSTAKVTLAQGDFFTLEAPSSIKDGYTFYGWYLGDERITDESGHSLGVCKWDTTQTLTASYFIKISTIYEFMDLGGHDLDGNYLVTQDLDFKGLGINYINSFKGTFDFGGHTLSNFKLLSGATSSTPSGLFRELLSQYIPDGGNTYGTTTIKNLIIKDASCSEEWASGIVGTINSESVKHDVALTNITIENSFNSSMVSCLIGECTSMWDVTISHIKIEDSGLNSLAYMIGYLGVQKSSYSNSLPDCIISEAYIKSNKPGSTKAGIVYCAASKYYEREIKKVYGHECVEINHFSLSSPAECGICWLRSSESFEFGKIVEKKYSTFSYYGGRIKVKASQILVDTICAWGNVAELTDSFNCGKTQEWGADSNQRIVDAGSEVGNYSYGNGSDSIVSSINLYPDANGAYTYWSQSGDSTTLSDASLINKDFFVSLLGFDETIWNLDQINVADKAYPVLR